MTKYVTIFWEIFKKMKNTYKNKNTYKVLSLEIVNFAAEVRF